MRSEQGADKLRTPRPNAMPCRRLSALERPITILAIHLEHDDPNRYQGPPYIAKEVVFDEHEMEHCHLTDRDATVAAIREWETSCHPGYPDEVVCYSKGGNRYPHEGGLRFDQREADGEILQPYAGRREEGGEMGREALPVVSEDVQRDARA